MWFRKKRRSKEKNHKSRIHKSIKRRASSKKPKKSKKHRLHKKKKTPKIKIHKLHKKKKTLRAGVYRKVRRKKEKGLKKLQGRRKKNYFEDVKGEIRKVVVGQDYVVESTLRAILSKGHVLIEGVPGIAKTLLIRTLAEVLGCEFSRIQFTVDLLPADITGITTYTPGRGFETIKGPIFANFVIADEINRAPPKTQSALLEAMQEKQVTIGKKTFKLKPPFFVMANNNPLESSGTYKLPEAQVDRFLFKLKMGYPKIEEEEEIIDQNITVSDFEDFKVKRVLSPLKILQLQKKTKEISASPQIKKYIVRIVDATRNPKQHNIKFGKYIDWGGSPRASIALQTAAKADALLSGKQSVSPQNIKNVAHDVLRHRILLNYMGQAENIDTDKIIDEILSKVKVP